MRAIGIAAIVLTAAATAMAATASVQRGKELFNSARVGSNGKSCVTCHENGSGIEEVASFSEERLAHTINSCISGALAGKPLPADSSDMKSLIMYLKTFATK